MKQIKVLNIFNELRYSGAEIRLLNGYEYWKKSNVVNDVISTGQIGPFVKEFENKGLNIYHRPFKKNLTFFLEFYRLLRRNNYDIVHIFTERANFYYALTALLAGKKVVRSVCNCFEFAGYKKVIRKFQRKLLANMGCRQVSISRSVQEIELTYYGNSTRLIENWYNDKKYHQRSIKEYQDLRDEMRITQETFVIISVGNCSRVKNHSLIINSLPRLKKMIDKILYLHIGGDEEGEEERKLAQELDVFENIKFLGYQQNVRKYLAVSDVFIMPSIYEGFGNASIEALSVGLPAILTNVPGSKDLKKNTGVTLVDLDEDSLIMEVQKLHALPFSKRFEIGNKANYDVVKNYSTERGTNQFIQLYKTLIN